MDYTTCLPGLTRERTSQNPQEGPPPGTRKGGTPRTRGTALSFGAPEPLPFVRVGHPDNGSGVLRTGSYRWSLPVDVDAARPASRRATGIRNGEQET